MKNKIVFALFLLTFFNSGISHAAVNAAMVWEIRSTGATGNGGGFKTGATGTDYSQQDAAQATLTTASTVHTTTTQINVAVGDYTVSANDVGNIFRNTGGTSTAGYYEITAVDVGNNRWTVDRSVGTAAQTVAGNMGGAISTIQNAMFQAQVAGNITYIKYSASAYTTAGNFASTSGSGSGKILYIGYNATRDDNPTGSGRPTIDFTTFSMPIGTIKSLRFLQYTGSHSLGVSFGENSDAYFCKFTSTSSTSTHTAANAAPAAIYEHVAFIGCEFVNASGIGLNSSGTNGSLVSAVGCVFNGCTTGFTQSSSQPIVAFMCLFKGNSTAIITNGGNTTVTASFCTFAGAATPSGVGINFGGGYGANINNCIFWGLTTGMTSSSNTNRQQFSYNNFYNNTTNRTNVNVGVGDTALDPEFTDAAAGDFSIGENLKGVGYPGVFPGGSSTGYPDVGAVQREETSGGGETSHAFVC